MYVCMYSVRKLFETGYISAVESSKRKTEQGIIKKYYTGLQASSVCASLIV